MALRKRTRFLKPRAVYLTHWITELMPSAEALVTPLSTALMIPSKCALTIPAAGCECEFFNMNAADE